MAEAFDGVCDPCTTCWFTADVTILSFEYNCPLKGSHVRAGPCIIRTVHLNALCVVGKIIRNPPKSVCHVAEGSALRLIVLPTPVLHAGTAPRAAVPPVIRPTVACVVSPGDLAIGRLLSVRTTIPTGGP